MNRVLIAGVLGAVALALAYASARPPRTADPRQAEAVAPAEAVFAERGYESLLFGRRAAVTRVTWSRAKHEGRSVVRDVTLVRRRSARMTGLVRDVFETSLSSDLLRTESGELIELKTVEELAERTDTTTVARTPGGYTVHTATGENEETFEIETDGPTQVDAETFLGPKIRAGEATPGAKFTCHVLSTRQRRALKSTLDIVGMDDEGPGLKVIQTTLGQRILWWFGDDGAVMRYRVGDEVVRRADDLTLDDLPDRPATNPITLTANVSLPRLFTGERMIVDVKVRTDETVGPPRIPENPFTETIRATDDTVRLRLMRHDDGEANTALPIPPAGFEQYLKATPLMEVSDPEVIEHARRAVGDAKDARTAAARIADYVFRTLSKGSPAMAEPTAREILANPIGDCSEHCLLFTALCRAAGIPARRCSGFVCIGDNWGSHAWCEIWVGRWIGADPTTNEIGTRARYIFLGRQDDPESVPARLRPARTRILIRRAEYDDGVVDLEKGRIDQAVLSGIRFGPLPEGWREQRSGRNASLLHRDFRADATIEPDQGYRAMDILARRYSAAEQTLFGGRPALRRRFNSRMSVWIVPLGRQNLIIRVTHKQRGAVLPDEQIAAAFKPTLDRDDG